MGDSPFIANLRVLDAAFEAATVAAFGVQTQTLKTNLLAADVVTFNNWIPTYNTAAAASTTTVTGLVTDYAVTLATARDAAITNYGNQIRARNVVLVAQFSLTHSPEDITRITNRLEATAVLAIAEYTSDLTAAYTAQLNYAMAKAANQDRYQLILEQRTQDFQDLSQQAATVFANNLISQNSIFARILPLGDTSFVNDLAITLATSDPPLTDEQRDALVTTRNTDRAQIITWRQALLVGLYQAALAQRVTECAAVLAQYNTQDLPSLAMKGVSIEIYYSN